MADDLKEHAAATKPIPASHPDPQTDSEIVALLEALLFVGARPVSMESVCRTFSSITEDSFQKAMAVLKERFSDSHRQLRLRETQEGTVLEVLPEARDAIQKRARSERGIKLPRQVVEVLSLVAYQQPVTREKLEKKLGNDIRAILRKLLRQQLIEISPESPSAKEPLYVTSARFLEMFGLESPADLPATDDLPTS